MAHDPLTGEIVQPDPACPACADLDEIATQVAADLRMAEAEIRKLRRKVGKLESDERERRRTARERPMVEEIFAYWVDRMGKNPKTTKLGDKREKAIVARLREGRDVEYFRQAIDGFSRFRPERDGRVYDDIELLCRDEVRLERYYGLGANIRSPREKPDLPSIRTFSSLDDECRFSVGSIS